MGVRKVFFLLDHCKLGVKFSGWLSSVFDLLQKQNNVTRSSFVNVRDANLLHITLRLFTKFSYSVYLRYLSA